MTHSEIRVIYKFTLSNPTMSVWSQNFSFQAQLDLTPPTDRVDFIWLYISDCCEKFFIFVVNVVQCGSIVKN